MSTMDDPVAYFFTWPTYGTWLPGDERGWVDFKHGWQLPDMAMRIEAEASMKENACKLNPRERQIVAEQVAETCAYRRWMLRAINIRSNHMHLVVSADSTLPQKIRTDIKAWCCRRLKERSNSDRQNWWAERGSIRWVFGDDCLETVLLYVNEAQDRKHLNR